MGRRLTGSQVKGPSNFSPSFNNVQTALRYQKELLTSGEQSRSDSQDGAIRIDDPILGKNNDLDEKRTVTETQQPMQDDQTQATEAMSVAKHQPYIAGEPIVDLNVTSAKGMMRQSLRYSIDQSLNPIAEEMQGQPGSKMPKGNAPFLRSHANLKSTLTRGAGPNKRSIVSAHHARPRNTGVQRFSSGLITTQ